MNQQSQRAGVSQEKPSSCALSHLFDDYVFASFDGIDGEGSMVLVGSGYQHQVNLCRLQELLTATSKIMVSYRRLAGDRSA